MMNAIPVYSFVAYSGTGKTTLLQKLIAVLKGRGYRVAVVKHDAHAFEIDRPGKDSWRLTKAGADVTIINCATHSAIMENRPSDTETLLKRITDVDLILTEGYKHGDHPKIGLFRAASGSPLPEVAGGYLAVLSDAPLQTDVPVLALNDTEALADFILADMQSRALR